MTDVTSKLTAQGQISVPAEIRRKLGIGPGSVISWHERNGEFVVRRAGSHSSDAVHSALFDSPPLRKVADVKKALRLAVRKRHARH